MIIELTQQEQILLKRVLVGEILAQQALIRSTPDDVAAKRHAIIERAVAGDLLARVGVIEHIVLGTEDAA